MKNNGKSDALQEAKYDVFISYSRKDYVDERTRQPIKDSPVARLIDFLDSHAVSYWIDREGIYAGAEFAELIATAISESKMMIFISSEDSNRSKWTAGEIKEAFDTGKLIIPLRIDDTPYNKKFRILVNSLDHIDYFSNPELSMEQLLKSINIEKEDCERKFAEEKARQAREEEEKRKEQIRKQITSDKNKYYLHSSNLKKESDLIISKLLSVGVEHKICPVCGENVPLQSQYCGTCGWTFVPSFEISEDRIDKEQLTLIKGLWDEVSSSRNTTVQNPEQVSRMKKEIEEYIARVSKLERDNSNLKDKVKSYRGKISQHGKTEKVLKEKISELEGKPGHSSQTSSAVNPRHDYVDLGLPSGILWATCNVGASKPSEYGYYFAWGETSPKNSYEWENLKYRIDGNSDENVRFSKYVSESNYGVVDNKTVLELSDDAAHVQWGGAWRMPTLQEWEELDEHCDWEWTAQNGYNGYKVTSKKNGASIFLPAAGWRVGESRYYEGVDGYYWSSSLYSDRSYGAFYCFFSSDGVNPSDWSYRYLGFSVRPVASSFQ